MAGTGMGTGTGTWAAKAVLAAMALTLPTLAGCSSGGGGKPVAAPGAATASQNPPAKQAQPGTKNPSDATGSTASAASATPAGPGATAPTAPAATPAPTRVPAVPGSTPGPAITTPAYSGSAPQGPAPQWRPLGTGSEITGGAPAFAVRFDPAVVRFELHAGSQVPGGAGWPGGSAAATKGLVAGWNGGFLLANGASWGGFYLGGKTAFGPLKANTASEVFYKDGSLDVLAWPGGAPSDAVAGVRQNLALMIDGGKLAANLNAGTEADEHTWGFTNDSTNVHGNRSGVGVTADGKILYAAVKGASPLQLAQFLQSAGAVRAMQLDINFERPIFGAFANGNWSSPAPWLGAASQLTLGNKRDFVAVYTK